MPTGSLGGRCMDASAGDVDGDGDLDLALAQEFATNLILRNDGAGHFSVTPGDVNGGNGDNEDVLLEDFDGDDDLDMLTVHEDDALHALLLNNGQGQFASAAGRINANSIANAVQSIDLNGDGRLDVILGNQGQNLVLIQDTAGVLQPDNTRSVGVLTTQDLLLLDIDGDTDLDLFVANETDNKLFVNDGNGFFADETATRLSAATRETREASAADVDNDGDLDIVLGNVQFVQTLSPENQLLINDGSGNFTDESATRLDGLISRSDSFTIAFVDVDRDGDQDILVPINDLGTGGSIVVWLNNGVGQYAEPAASVFSAAPSGSTFDIEAADFNGDGIEDLYLCHRTGTDQLYLGQ